jgi:predicted solute-binding protein
MTAEMNNSITTTLKDYEPDKLIAAIKRNYGIVYNSVEHYYKGKYSLEDFLAKKLRKFVEKADPLNKFKWNNKYNKADKTPRFNNYDKSNNYQFDDTKV